MGQVTNTSPLPLMVRDGVRCRYRPATSEQILAAARLIIDQKMQRGTCFLAPETANSYFRTKLAGYEHEVFVAVFLDTRHRLIAYAELFRGSIDGAEVHPREVVKEALRLNAAALIVAHNHPSGNPDPSEADRAVTIRLKQALSLVDVRLLDHIVVAGHESVSLAQRGWI